MRPSLRLRDAAMLLGTDRSVFLDTLDKVLGAGLLLAAPATGGAILALFTPKNDVIKCLEQARGDALQRLQGLTRRPRSEVIQAAHAVIVVSAFFDELPSAANLRALRPKKGKLQAVPDPTSRDGIARRQLVDAMLSSSVPTPALDVPYYDLVTEIEAYYSDLWGRIVSFLDGQALATERSHLSANALDSARQEFVPRAVSRYEGHLAQLAANSPELLFWVNLHQVAATQRQAGPLERNLRLAHFRLELLLREHQVGLKALEDMLRSSRTYDAARDRWAELANIYDAEFDRLVIEDRSLSELRVPRLSDCYVPPAFRVAAQSQGGSRFSEDRWWETEVTLRDDVEDF